MIITEPTEDGRIRHYSDQNFYIRQIETGNIYYDAVDVIPCRYTYEETDIEIEIQEDMDDDNEIDDEYDDYEDGYE